MIEIKTISSLDKMIGLDTVYPLKSASIFKGELYHFGVYAKSTYAWATHSLELICTSPIKDAIKIYRVDNSPVFFDNYAEHDDYVDFEGEKYVADVLEEDLSRLVLPQWKYLFLEVEVDGTNLSCGEYKIEFLLKDAKGEEYDTVTFSLEVIDATLPKQEFLVTQWLHPDCIANVHGVDIFSDEFFDLFKEYVSTAVRYGQNMLLTPLFTYPLDTEINHERRTFQLVRVKKTNGAYSFDFSLLQKYIQIAMQCGIQQIEFSHLFTQWGLKGCPKIVAEVDGKEQKIFGWAQNPLDEEYLAFLDVFLDELILFIKERGYEELCWFHISDEATKEYLERYKEAYQFVRRKIGNMRIIDAMSDYALCESGCVDIPSVCIDSVQPFMEHNVKHFVYYACLQYKDYYSNRFMAMPLQRTRIIGMQAYLGGAMGFLHWGLNFYSSGLSFFPIDPYRNTDAGGFFPAGDPFIVYPGKNGVKPSLRLFAFGDGLQDYRALQLLESLKGREFVVSLLKAEGVDGYNVYPRSKEWHLRFREKVNQLVKESI